MKTDASGFAASSTGFAETFASNEQLEPGDLVVLDASGPERVKKSGSSDGVVLGIVSQDPAFLAGASDHASGSIARYPVAFEGKTVVKATTENGPIKTGDYLAPATTPGKVMKASPNSPILAVALEDFNESHPSGTLMVYVKPSFGREASQNGAVSGGNGGSSSGGSRQSPRSGLATIKAGDKSVHVSFETLGGYPVLRVTSYEVPNGTFGIREVSDTGFTIVLSEMQFSDMTFAWTAEPPTEVLMPTPSIDPTLPTPVILPPEERPPDDGEDLPPSLPSPSE